MNSYQVHQILIQIQFDLWNNVCSRNSVYKFYMLNLSTDAKICFFLRSSEKQCHRDNMVVCLHRQLSSKNLKTPCCECKFSLAQTGNKRHWLLIISIHGDSRVLLQKTFVTIWCAKGLFSRVATSLNASRWQPNVGRHHEGNELSVIGSSLQLHGGFIASEFNFLSFFPQSSILFCAPSCASI